MDKKTIALVGNPNCGKTTLFNGLTGGRQKTGNWPGVTVEKIEGDFKHDGTDIHVVDLPGIYSLSAYSEDEQVSRDYLLSNEADLVINLVDASNIERNLYLTTHLLEMNVPLMIVFTMKDVATTKEIHLKKETIAKALNLPVEYITATNKRDVSDLKKSIVENIARSHENKQLIHYENEVEEGIAAIERIIATQAAELNAPERWLAIKLIEGDAQLESRCFQDEKVQIEVEKSRDTIEQKIGDEADIVIADGRYGFIHGLVQSTVTKGEPQKSMTDRIDSVVLNRFWGIPIFLLVMYFVFWATIGFGGAFIDFFDILFGTIFVDGTGCSSGKFWRS